MLSSASRTTKDNDKVIELSSSEPAIPSRPKKRTLSDADEAAMEEARVKRPSLRTLYDSDSDVKEVPKKAKKNSKTKVEASGGAKEAAKTVKKNGKRVVEVARGGRGGRARGRGGKVAVQKSRAIITDSDEEVEVASSEPTEALLPPPPPPPPPPQRPKPKPAFDRTKSVAADTLALTTTAALIDATPSAPVASSQPSTNEFTESSLTTSSESSTYIPATVPIARHEQESPANPTTTVTGSTHSHSTITSTVVLPPAGDIFDGDLGSGDSTSRPQLQTGWDRSQYIGASMQRTHTNGLRAFTTPRDSRFDTGREPFRTYSRPPGPYRDGMGTFGEAGWEAGGRHDSYHHHNFRPMGHQDAGWDVGGRGDYREFRRVGRGEGGLEMGDRYQDLRYADVRQMGREEVAMYNTDYAEPLHHGQNPGTRLAEHLYPNDSLFGDDQHYLQLPPVPPPSRASTSTSPFTVPGEVQGMESNMPPAQPTPHNTT
jgi:hypothetical protein